MSCGLKAAYTCIHSSRQVIISIMVEGRNIYIRCQPLMLKRGGALAGMVEGGGCTSKYESFQLRSLIVYLCRVV